MMRPPPGHAHYPSASGEGRARAARGTPGRAGRVRSCEGRRGGLLKRLCEGSERLCGGSERAPSGSAAWSRTQRRRGWCRLSAPGKAQQGRSARRRSPRGPGLWRRGRAGPGPCRARRCAVRLRHRAAAALILFSRRF